MLKRLIQTLSLFCCVLHLQAQDGNMAAVQPDSLVQIPSCYLDQVSSKAGQLEQKLDNKSEKALRQMQKLEQRMMKKMAKLDSSKAKEIFGDAEQKYKDLEQRLEKGISSSQYLPAMDTAITALRLLQQNQQLISTVKDGGKKIKEAMNKVAGMESKFKKADEIKKWMRGRKQYLNEKLQHNGFAKELKQLNKQVYYYSAQLKEYKELLKDHRKAERKVLELLGKTKVFQKFFQKNSFLASLFRMPDGDDPSSFGGAGGVLSGLQTRASVTSLIQNQLAAGGPNAQQQFQQNIAQAQSQLSELKNKINQMGGGSSDEEMPEGFKANPAKSLSFIKRIKIGADFQTSRHNRFFPVNSDLGLSLSYMLNSNSHFSIGTSFKMGWGSGFNNIRFSAQGASVRGVLDWRLKGNLFIAGSYEQNYFSEIRNIEQLRDYSSWKTAALFGLSKKFNSPSPFGGRRKGAKGAKVSLLYDVFYKQPPVQTQPVIMRIGFNI